MSAGSFPRTQVAACAILGCEHFFPQVLLLCSESDRPQNWNFQVAGRSYCNLYSTHLKSETLAMHSRKCNKTPHQSFVTAPRRRSHLSTLLIMRTQNTTYKRARLLVVGGDMVFFLQDNFTLSH